MAEDLSQLLLEGVFGGALGVLGVAGNLVSIRVLGRSRDLDMTPTFRHLLRMLAAFDATFLAFTVSLFCASTWSAWYSDHVRPHLTPYWLPVIQISLTGSVWTTMAVSIERYLTVCFGYRPNTVQHLFYTVPILSLAFLFNVTRFFELETVLATKNITVSGEVAGDTLNVTRVLFDVQPTELRSNPMYSYYYVLLANTFLLCFIPVAVLVILNACIYRTITRATKLHNAISSHQRRDHSVAMMLLVIVVVFICCHSIRSIINTYECIQMAMHGKLRDWPVWIKFLVQANHLALVINSSTNILIYACKDEKFLQVLLVTLRLRQQRHGVPSSLSRAPPKTTTTAPAPETSRLIAPTNTNTTNNSSHNKVEASIETSQIVTVGLAGTNRATKTSSFRDAREKKRRSNSLSSSSENNFGWHSHTW